MTVAHDPHPLADLLTETVIEYRRLRHPIERVWRAVSDPDELARWMAPADLEARVGRAYRLDFGRQGAATGVVTAAEPPRLLELTWSEPGWQRASAVRFELEPTTDGCLLTLSHHLLPGDRLANFGAGWHAFLDVLAGHLAGAPVPDRWAELHPLYEEALPKGGVGPWVRMERVLPADPPRVWQALCDPADRERWLGASGTMEPRSGSPVRLVFGPGLETTGEVTRAEPVRLLSLRWHSRDAARSELTFRLSPHPGGTLLVLTHRVEEGDLARMAAGWRAQLRQLRALLTGEEPVWDDEWFRAGLRTYAVPSAVAEPAPEPTK